MDIPEDVIPRLLPQPRPRKPADVQARVFCIATHLPECDAFARFPARHSGAALCASQSSPDMVARPQESAFARAARRVQTIVPLLRGAQKDTAAEAVAAAQAAVDAERAMAEQQALQELQEQGLGPAAAAAVAAAVSVGASGVVSGGEGSSGQLGLAEGAAAGGGAQQQQQQPDEGLATSASAAALVEELSRQPEGWWGHPAVQAAAGGARRVAQVPDSGSRAHSSSPTACARWCLRSDSCLRSD